VQNSETVAIKLIGPPRVESADSVIDIRSFGGARCASAFSYLAMNEGRSVTHSELADVVWSEHRPPTWAAALRSVVAKVRQLLAASQVLTGCTLVGRSGALTLILAPSVAVDLAYVRSLMERIGPDLTARDRAQRASMLLAVLVAPALEGVHSRWSDDVREVFERIRLRALEVDAVASSELGRHDHALARAGELLAVDPFCEAAYRVAMRAHVGLGNRARALGVAQRCRTVLADELGVEMSSETQAVFSELLGEPTQRTIRSSPSERRNEVRGDGTGDVSFDAGLDSAIIGSERQLEDIAAAIADAARGWAHLVVVAGAAGAGKTMLVREAMRQAEHRGAEVFFGRCSIDALVPFEPFIDASSRTSNGDGEVVSGSVGRRARATALSMLTTGWLEPEHSVGADLSMDHRGELVAALEHWLTGSPESSVTVLVIDDLQWASPATVMLLRRLLHMCVNRRLCVVVTMRGTGREHDDAASALRSALTPIRVRSVAVRGLSVDDVAEWIRRTGSALDPHWLHSWTAGLPIFVDAVIEAQRHDPRAPSPSTLADAVHWVLHRVSPHAREITVVCALSGIDVGREVVRGAVRCTDAAFVAALDELTAAGMIVSASKMLSIRHDLIGDVIEGSVSETVRARTHSAIAAALIEVGATSTVDELARIAGHLERGLDTDRSSVTDILRRAADRACAVTAYEDAAMFYDRAFAAALPAGDTRLRCELLIEQGRAQRRALDRRYRTTLLEAVKMARRLRDLDLLVDALTSDVIDGVALFQLYDVDHERLECLDAGLSMLEGAGRGSTAAAAHLLAQMMEEMAWSPLQWRRRTALALRALEVARQARDTSALMHGLRAVLTSMRVPMCRSLRDQATAELRELLEHEHRATDPSLAVTLARGLIESGDPASAAGVLESVDTTRLALDAEARWTVDCAYFGLTTIVGDLSGAEKLLTRLVLHLPPAPMGAHTWGRDKTALLLLRMLRGDLSEVAELRDDVEPQFDAIPAYRAAIGLALVDGDRLREAREVVVWFAGRLGAVPMGTLWLATIVLAARAGAEVGDSRVCEESYEALVPYAGHTVVLTPGVLGVVDQHLAHVCCAVGRWALARAHVERALVLHVERGYTIWEAESLALSVHIDIESGGTPNVAAFERARSIAESCGATAVLRRMEALAVSLRPAVETAVG
jgi:DNA-binding SARP family transcriptional activator